MQGKGPTLSTVFFQIKDMKLVFLTIVEASREDTGGGETAKTQNPVEG